MRNFYKILGIASTADDGRIKSAFRRRAKAVHPDLNPGKDRAEARFIELMQAYEVLRDAESRATYDAHLAECRSLARRRFAHCAGLMAASFMMTAASAVIVMGLAGANVPIREGWQTAVTVLSPRDARGPAVATKQDDAGWTAQVAVAPEAEVRKPAPSRPEAVRDTKPQQSRSADPRPAVAASGPAAKSHQGGPAASSREHRQRVASRATQPSTGRPVPSPQPPTASEEGWWPWPAAEEPRYSLGASDLR